MVRGPSGVPTCRCRSRSLRHSAIARPLGGAPALPYLARPPDMSNTAPVLKRLASEHNQGHPVSHLVRRPEPLHRAVGDHPFDDSHAEVADHVGVDRARRDAIDEDVLPDHFAAERFAEGDHAGACRRVSGQVGETSLAGQRTEIDDPPSALALQVRKHRPRDLHRADQVDIQDAAPVVGVRGRRTAGSGRGNRHRSPGCRCVSRASPGRDERRSGRGPSRRRSSIWPRAYVALVLSARAGTGSGTLRRRLP